MNDMTHVTDLTAGYALKALTPDEARTVEAHCAVCAACAADLAEMNSLASLLPLAADPVSPSPSLKRRIMTQTRLDASAGEFLRNPARRAALPRLTWWAAAAAAVFIAGSAMGVSAMVDHQRMVTQQAQMASQVDALQRQLAINQGAIAEIAGAQRVWDISGGRQTHWWHCTLVQPSHRKAPMLVASMPPAPAGKTFQAWIVRRGRMHDAGIVPAGTKSMMHLPMAVQSGDVIAFTLEPMGGSATPTMPFAMSQRLD